MRSRTVRTTLALLVWLGLVLGGCSDKPENPQLSQVDEAWAENGRLHFFREHHPSQDVIKWAEEDLNGDGRTDLVVIYRVDPEHNGMRVILDLGRTFFETNEVPAPYSDQVIQFRDIDRKPPMEFIVQGARGANMGFAVFRIEANRLVDLFGEGMRDCC